MRNALPANGPSYRESALLNLDDASGPGTYWAAYRKHANKVVYFESFGDLKPPIELMIYLGIDEIMYNYQRYQDFNTYNCGHLCLQFLSEKLVDEFKKPI